MVLASWVFVNHFHQLLIIGLISQLYAVDIIQWKSPGNICSCKGHTVTLNWTFTSNITWDGYSFCYNPKEQRLPECEDIILYAQHDKKEEFVIATKYRNRASYVGETIGNQTNVRLALNQVDFDDTATYSIQLEGPMIKNEINNQCRLKVVEGVRNILISIRDSFNSDVRAQPLYSSKLYSVDVVYASDVTYNAIVLLRVNGDDKFQSACPSPCTIVRQFPIGNITVEAKVAYCGCHSSNLAYFQVVPPPNPYDYHSSEDEYDILKHIQNVVITCAIGILVTFLLFWIFWKYIQYKKFTSEPVSEQTDNLMEKQQAKILKSLELGCCQSSSESSTKHTASTT